MSNSNNNNGSNNNSNSNKGVSMKRSNEEVIANTTLTGKEVLVAGRKERLEIVMDVEKGPEGTIGGALGLTGKEINEAMSEAKKVKVKAESKARKVAVKAEKAALVVEKKAERAEKKAVKAEAVKVEAPKEIVMEDSTDMTPTNKEIEILNAEYDANDTMSEGANMNTITNKGEGMKDLMKSLGLTVKELAETVGCSTSTIYNVFKGKAGEASMDAVTAYLEEMAYWAGKTEEVERPSDLVSVEGLPEFKDLNDLKEGNSLTWGKLSKNNRQALINAWYVSNKEVIEPADLVSIKDDKFFTENASVLKEGLYGVISPVGRKSVKAIMHDELVPALKINSSTNGQDAWAVGEYVNSKGETVTKYDDGGIVGDIAKRSQSEINFGNANDSEFIGRSSLFEDGYDAATVRVNDHGGNYIMAGSFSEFFNYEVKEQAKIVRLAEPAFRELNRKARKEVAIRELTSVVAQIKAATSYKVIKEDIIGGAYKAITGALNAEFGNSFIADRCVYVSAKDLKVDTTGMNADELMAAAVEADAVSNLNAVFWKIAYRAMYAAVNESAWKLNKNVKAKDANGISAEDLATYEKVQALLDSVPSEDSEDLGALIKDGTAAKFGLTKEDAKKATWFAYSNRENRGLTSSNGRSVRFSRPVFGALIAFGKAS